MELAGQTAERWERTLTFTGGNRTREKGPGLSLLWVLHSEETGGRGWGERVEAERS